MLSTAAAAGPSRHALALGFSSRAQSAFDSRRLRADHTLSLWFLAQYEGAGAAVLFSDATGGYRVALAPYRTQTAVALQIDVGGGALTLPLPEPVLSDTDFRRGAPEQPFAKWRHLALTLHGRSVHVYLDAVLAGEFESSTPVFAMGDVFFGAAPGARVTDQLHGLIDDVQLFEGALSVATLTGLARRGPALAPASDPIAAWLFEPGSAASPHAPAVTLLGAATYQPVSVERVPLRVTSLPRPALQTTLRLPFEPGQVWLVIQGFDSALSHHDEAAFALDFLRVEPAFVASNTSRVPGASHAQSFGQPVLAAAAGEVVSVVDCFPDDNGAPCPGAAYPSGQPPAVSAPAANRNLVCVRHALAEVSCYLHLQQHSALVHLGSRVVAGAPLGRVGRSGAPRVHLHFALSDVEEPSTPGTFNDLRTRPFEFHDYSASDDFGASWRYVRSGVPTPGQWVAPGHRGETNPARR